MLNRTLANEPWEGDQYDLDIQRLQLNAFHNSGDAFDAMFRVANQSLAQVKHRRGMAKLSRDATRIERAEADVAWVTGAVNAASAAQQVWSLTVAFTATPTEAEAKIARALWNYLENNTFFQSEDERNWFEEICGAAENQEYAALIIYQN